MLELRLACSSTTAAYEHAIGVASTAAGFCPPVSAHSLIDHGGARLTLSYIRNHVQFAAFLSSLSQRLEVYTV